ncbi:VanZ family protein [Acidicapsa dinghuensis]|nr:VanZ family protein [Acidicapsa dinghuensis]
MLSAWLPVLFCVLVIAVESTAYFGADHTTGPLRRFCEWLLHHRFADAQWDEVHHYIRKCGHFTGYGILSAAWFRAFWMTFRQRLTDFSARWKLHGLALLGTLLVASADEFHQSFLPNRTSSIYDVLLDCTGGLVVQLLIWTVMRGRNRDSKHGSLAG